MDTNRLRYFTVVASVGSVRKAAELLRLSPPAISKAIKALEAEVGVPLLVQSGRGVVVTPRGRALAERAGALLGELDRTYAEIRGEAAGPAPLRFATFEVFSTYALTHMCGAYFDGAPMTVHELVPGPLEQALLDGLADYGITYVPIPTAGVEHVDVAKIDMGVYARRGAFAGVPFAELPFAVPIHPVVGSPTKVQGLDGWPEGRVQRLVRHRVAMLQTALLLCSAGLAVSYMPQFVVRLYNETVTPDLRLTPLPLPARSLAQKQPVYLVRRSGEQEDAQVRRIAKALRLTCKS